jgi:hypothetical protein
MINKNIDPILYKKAENRVEEIKGYYIHLAIYVLVNIFLFLLNALTNPSEWWFYWTTFGWGIGILAHTFATFGIGNMLGEKWKNQQIEKYIQQNQSQNQDEETKQ